MGSEESRLEQVDLHVHEHVRECQHDETNNDCVENCYMYTVYVKLWCVLLLLLQVWLPTFG